MKVFVSYSRRDFHSAEAVTAALWAHEPLDPWFDLQRLRPGMDWEVAWDDALETADALLLLASPSAIASEYVRMEWGRALERGIPVYVGVTAGTDVPPELDASPVHDLRVRFWQRMHALGEEIVRTGAQCGSEPAGDESRPGRPVPQRPSQRLPRLRVPASIAGFVVCAATMGVALVWASVLMMRLDISVGHLAGSPFGEPSRLLHSNSLNGLRLRHWHQTQYRLLTLTAMMAPFGPAVLAVAVGLARRSCGWVSLVVTVGCAVTVLAACGYSVRALLSPPDIGDPTVARQIWPTPAAVTEEAAAVTRLLTVAAVAAAVCLGCALWSRWFYLWLPAGLGVAYQRRRATEVPYAASGPRRSPLRPSRNPGLRPRWREIRQSVREPQPGVQWRGKNWRFLLEWLVLCRRNGVGRGRPVGNVVLQVQCLARADEPIAELLRTALQLAGVGASSETGADTRTETVAPSAGWSFVLVSSHVDWVDVAEATREGAPRTICVLLDQVDVPDDTKELRRYQWLDFREQRPEHLYALVAAVSRPDSEPGMADPVPVPVVADRFRAPLPARGLVSMFRMAAAFAPGFALARLFFAPTSPQSAALTVLAVASAAVLLRMAGRLAARRLTPAQLTRSHTVALTLAVLWCATGASILWTPVLLPGGVAQTFLPKDQPGAGLLVVGLVALLCGYIVALVLAPLPFLSPTHSSWLPRAKAMRPRRPLGAALTSWDGYTLLLAWLLFSFGTLLYMNYVQVNVDL